MIFIKDVAHGRDNNFNLIRMLAASSVLFSHSFVLALGNASDEPLNNIIGMSPGAISVDIFFVTSGFLVTASLLRSRNIASFALARFLRIWPALVVVTLLTAVVVGASFTALPLAGYFGDWHVYRYIARNIILFLDVDFKLPEVFDTNPVPNVMNGSLWTMPYEVRMYALLGAAWVLAALALKRRHQLFNIVVPTVAAISFIVALLFADDAGQALRFNHLFFMFFSGATFYVLRDQIPFSPAISALFACAMLVGFFVEPRHFFYFYLPSIGYVTLYLAYMPVRILHQYNRLGDYSYGLYIFAYPIQQIIMAVRPGAGPMTLFSIAFPATLLFAIASWMLVERRALTFKEQIRRASAPSTS